MRKGPREWKNIILTTLGIISITGITFFLTIYFVWQLTNVLGV